MSYESTKKFASGKKGGAYSYASRFNQVANQVPETKRLLRMLSRESVKIQYDVNAH